MNLQDFIVNIKSSKIQKPVGTFFMYTLHEVWVLI